MSQKQTENDLINKKIDELSQNLIKNISTYTNSRTYRNLIKRVKELDVSETTIKQILNLFAIFMSTGMGQWLATLVILELLAKMKFFSQLDVNILMGVLTSVEVIKALSSTSSTSFLGEIGGIAALLGGGSV
ncbi:MAG: hypothetical protein QXV17_10760 [Candidatus Micrarchaeaceae archaeon]